MAYFVFPQKWITAAMVRAASRDAPEPPFPESMSTDSPLGKR